MSIRKANIENACKEEEIFIAVTTLAMQSEDKYVRQTYQRREELRAQLDKK